jgi:RNA polymerase sigma-70 factor (ECF subfamily)
MSEASSATAVQRLFEQHATWIGQILRHFGLPEADIADGVQEVFLLVDRRYSELEDRSEVSRWLGRICSSVAMSHLRRLRSRREQLTWQLPDAGVEADQHVRVERSEERLRLQHLLNALDEEQRAVIVLYELHGLRMREVAEAVGCPIQTAYSRRNAALSRLRKSMLADGLPAFLA